MTLKLIDNPFISKPIATSSNSEDATPFVKPYGTIKFSTANPFTENDIPESTTPIDTVKPLPFVNQSSLKNQDTGLTVESGSRYNYYDNNDYHNDDGITENNGDIVDDSDRDSADDASQDVQEVSDDFINNDNDDIDTSYDTETAENSDTDATSGADVNVLDSVATMKPDEIAALSEGDKLEILENKPSKAAALAILSSNPSLAVMAKIGDYLDSDDLSNQDKDELMKAVVKSKVFEGANSPLPNLSPGTQIALMNNMEREQLGNIDKGALSSTANDALEARLAEFKKHDGEQPTNRFGLLTA